MKIWSGFGADPYLAGEAAFETIVGIQNAGVQAWYAVPFEFKNHDRLLSTAQSIISTSEIAVILLGAERAKVSISEQEHGRKTTTSNVDDRYARDCLSSPTFA